MSSFKSIGYYIVEEAVVSLWMAGIPSGHILTPSSCICNMHSDLSACFWAPHDREAKLYAAFLGLDPSEFSDMEKAVRTLFDAHLISVDSCFSHLKDAEDFYESYIKSKNNNIKTRLIGCFAEKSCLSLFREDYRNVNTEVEEKDMCGTFLGYDILGWDISGFHSYVCNSLQNEIKNIKFNHYGLTANSYEDVVSMANFFNEKELGEPVDWFPCAVCGF